MLSIVAVHDSLEVTRVAVSLWHGPNYEDIIKGVGRQAAGGWAVVLYWCSRCDRE